MVSRAILLKAFQGGTIVDDTKKLYLGIDLGTSSVKLLLVDDEGNISDNASASYPTLGTEEGKAEQEPDAWVAAIRQACSELSRNGTELAKVAAIGLSAQMPTYVSIDASGRPVGRAIVWSDGRADTIGETLLDRWGHARHYSRTGVVLDGRYIVPMHLWAQAHQNEESEECRHILSAKDFIHYWLAGSACTDPSTASGFGLYSLATGRWDDSLCGEAGIDQSLLPPIYPSEAPSGALSRDTADQLGLRPGVPIICGAADSVAGVLGMGALEPGQICQIAGSSTALVAVSCEAILDPRRRYIVTPLAMPLAYGLEADILSSGTSLAWFSGILDAAARSNVLPPAENSSIGDLKRLSRLAEEAPLGSDGLLFFPYMAGGEQAVLWDPELRGGLLGLSLRHGIPHLARALYEGICFEIRRCIETFKDAGFQPTNMICSGPISRDTFYMQLLANTSGIECRPSASDKASALGAALLAGIGDRAWTFAELGSILPCQTKEVWEPEHESKICYDKLFQDYVVASRNSRKPVQNLSQTSLRYPSDL
jgi:xylulokinase